MTSHHASDALHVNTSLLSDPALRDLLRYFDAMFSDALRSSFKIGFSLIVAAMAGWVLFLMFPPQTTAEAILRIQSEASAASEKTSDVETEMRVLTSWEQMQRTLAHLPYPARIKIENMGFLQRLSLYLGEIFRRDETEQTLKSLNSSLRFGEFSVPANAPREYLTLQMAQDYRMVVTSESSPEKSEGALGASLALPSGVAMTVTETSLMPGQEAQLLTHYNDSRLIEIYNMMEIDKIGVGARSNMIRLKITHKNAAFAEDYLQSFVNSYLEYTQGSSTAGLRKTLAYTEQELQRLGVEFAKAQQALDSFYKVEQVVNLPLEADVNLKRLVELERDLLDLAQKKTQFSVSMNPAHPVMAALAVQARALESERKALHASTQKLPFLEQRLFALTFDLNNTKRLYEMTLDEKSRLQSKIESVIGYASIIKPPSIERVSLIKQSARYASVGGWLMMLFWVLFIAMRNLPMFAKVTRLDQLHGLSSLPVLPTMFGVATRKGKAAPHDPAYQNLAQFLPVMAYGRHSRIFWMAHATSQTAVSAPLEPLATLLAQEKKLLLIDGNMVDQTLTRAFSAQNTPGFADLIMGTSTAKEAIAAPTGKHPYYFLSAGRPCPSHVLLSRTERLQALFEALAQGFDYILVDMPSLHQHPELAHVMQTMGGNILVPVAQGTALRHVMMALSAVSAAAQGVMMFCAAVGKPTHAR